MTTLPDRSWDSPATAGIRRATEACAIQQVRGAHGIERLIDRRLKRQQQRMTNGHGNESGTPDRIIYPKS